MRVMISAYREDNDDVKFKFIHVFARIETYNKWTKTWTALTKANAMYEPATTPLSASDIGPLLTRRPRHQGM
jgi:hypothetical protein